MFGMKARRENRRLRRLAEARASRISDQTAHIDTLTTNQRRLIGHQRELLQIIARHIAEGRPIGYLREALTQAGFGAALEMALREAIDEVNG